MDSATKLQNKLDKWEQKTDRYKASISRLEMKSQAIHDKQDKPLKSYTVVMYGSHDSITGENTVNFRLDSSATTKSQYEKDKPRGLLHKLDAHIKTEDIGFIVPVIKKDDNNSIGSNGAINTNAGRRRIVLQNKALPTVLQNAVPYTKRTLLAAENAVIKAGDSFKRTAQPIAMTASNALKMQVSNEMYKSAQENTGLKATMGIANATISTAQMVHKWSSNRRQYMVAQKGLKLEQKTELMKAKVEKLEMKSAMAKEKHIYKELRKNAKENGLDLKFTRAEKKKAWKKVFDSAQKGNYLEQPKMKSFQKASKADVLAAAEFKAAKQVYHTKIVKEKVFNTATGRTHTKYRRVIDKSRKKVQKPKKPDDFFLSASKMGLGALGNKVTAELANSDDVGTQALGKGLQFSMSELSRANQKRVMNSKLKFDKRIEKAQMKMEKAHNELQIEKSKPEQPKPKKKDKKAMKKAAAKNRNAKQFKENLKQKAKKLKEKAVAEVKELVKKKMLPALIGVGGGVVILLLVIIMPILLLGGNADTGAVVGVASYTTDRDGLTKFNTEVNEAYWYWMDSINKTMNDIAKDDTEEWLLVLNPCKGGPVTNCPNQLADRAQANANNPDYVEDEANVYSLPSGEDANVTRVVKHLYKGENVTFSNYDILCLYAYYTVKYRNEDWGSFTEELENYFKANYIVACKDENGDIVKNESTSVLLDIHYTTTCNITGSKDPVTGQVIPQHHHTTTSEDHYVDTTEIWMHYFLYPQTDGSYTSIQDYIADQIKSIGAVDEEGISEGEKHYAMLMKSMGYHQAVDLPVYYMDAATNTMTPVDWSNSPSVFGSYGEMYDVNEAHKVDGGGYDVEGMSNDMRYKKVTSDSVEICCYNFTQLDVVAGGNGVIKEKTSDTVVVEYPDSKLKITYICKTRDNVTISNGIPTGMTTLGIGAEVKAGEHLFYANGDNDTRYPMVEIKAYDTELKRDINPLLVVRSRVYE